MLKIVKITLLLCICVGYFQCTNHSVSPSNRLPRELTESEKQLIDSDNTFGFKLFKEIVSEKKDENVFVSPLSVAMALGMTYNGARGTTQEAMQSTLELYDMNLQEVNESYESLIELLIDLDPEAIFHIANSIWYREGFPVERDFVDLNREYFDALVRALDFNAPDAAETINNWVNENTNGKIEEIVDDPIDRWTVMFLINAIYFKGTWTYEFDKDLTMDDWFTRPDGSQVPCKMMVQEAPFHCLSTNNFQAVDLPYGNGNFSMTIVLPYPNTDIDAFISELNNENWDQWTENFSEDEGRLWLPRFTLAFEMTLNDVLKALGMEIAFDPPRADFTGMNREGGLFISNVKHKSFVDVNEEGTEAAAVTSVEIGRGSEPPSGFWMRVDRPFLFMIREHESQTILFMGKIVEPTL